MNTSRERAVSRRRLSALETKGGYRAELWKRDKMRLRLWLSEVQTFLSHFRTFGLYMRTQNLSIP